MNFQRGEKSLSSEESIQLNLFFITFLKASRRKLVIPIFRGDNLKALAELLGLDPPSVNLTLLSDRLFLIGTKSRHYFSENYFGEKIGETFAIDDTSDEVFMYIFNQLTKSIRNSNSVNQKFYEKNRTFRDYYTSNKNRTDFIEKMSKMKPKERLKVRNYYLGLIHQFSPKGYKTKSHIVSTSTRKSIAKRFAVGRGNQHEVIIHAWTNKCGPENTLLNRMSLPKYVGSPYPQEEISIIAGILPHYIIGLEIPSQNIFLVNPGLFTCKITQQRIINGLIINQHNFYQELRKTNYGYSFIENSGEIKDIKIG